MKNLREGDDTEGEWKKYKDVFLWNCRWALWKIHRCVWKHKKKQEWWTTDVTSVKSGKKEAWVVI